MALVGPVGVLVIRTGAEQARGPASRAAVRAAVHEQDRSRVDLHLQHPLGEVGDLVGMDALVREHDPLLGRVGAAGQVQGADEAADGQPAGGVLVQVDRRLGVVR